MRKTAPLARRPLAAAPSPRRAGLAAVALPLSLALCLCAPPAAALAETGAAGDEAAVVFTNDVHCAIDQTFDSAGTLTGLGYAGLAAFVGDARAQCGDGNVTLVDAGDAVQGAAVGTVTEGEAVVALMNLVGYDYAVPGNHEFDYGMDQFERLVGLSDATYLSCNFVRLPSGEPVLAAYALETYDAAPAADDEDGTLTVAFVGICTPETLTKSSPANFQDDDGNYVFGFAGDATGAALYDAVQSAVDAARAEGADYVVAVGHLGNDGITSRWTSRAVIANTTGIDVLIDGHSHETYLELLSEAPSLARGGSVTTLSNAAGDDVILAQTGTKLANVGELVIDPDAGDGEDLSVTLTSASSYAKVDAAVQAAVDETNAELQEELGQVVGRTDVDLTCGEWGEELYVRTCETNMGDFVADAYRVVMGADIGLANGGGIRASISAGDITYEDLINVQPYGNELCLIEATGQDILDALEHAARELPEASGGFLQVSGLTYEIDTSIPSSVETDENGNFVAVTGARRVHDVRVGGVPIDPNATYTVASHDYMLLEGGDGMTMFADCPVLLDSVILDNQALIDYMTDHLGGVVGEQYASPSGEGRIVFAAAGDATDDATDGAAGDGADDAADGGADDTAGGAGAGDGQSSGATQRPAAHGPLPSTGEADLPLAGLLAAAAAAVATGSVALRRAG